MLKKVDFLVGGLGYLVSTLFVCCAIVAGCKTLPSPVAELHSSRSIKSAFFYWDGARYRSIAMNGYSYSPDRPSDVAFFPLYPFTARALAYSAGINISAALLLVSNCFLAGSFILLHAYARARFPSQPAMPASCLIAFALYSPTLFFHLPYSESVFTFLTLLALLALHYNSSIGILAVIIGTATAARPVGICLLPLIFFASSRLGGPYLCVFCRTLCYIPIASFGVLCFMLLQYLFFSEPLAFAKTQFYWRNQIPVDWSDRIHSLLVFEPFWGGFDPSSTFYWHAFDHNLPSYLSMMLFNRFAFAFALMLLLIGFNSKLLNAPEVILSALLILVPYVAKGYDNSMISMARFSAVALPLYCVAGWLLVRLPRLLAVSLSLLSSIQLLTFSALFGAGYKIF